MKDQLEKIKEDALKQIEASDALEKLNEIRVAYLGKKGELTSVLKSMKDVPPEERPKVGQMVNDARAIIENRLEEAKASLAKKAREEQMKREVIDVTLPAKRNNVGHSHPNTIALEEVERIFVGMGFDAVVGLAVVAFGAGIGFSGAAMNPFTMGVAQGIAEVPYMSGAGFRVVCHIIMLVVGSAMIMRYALKVKKDPTKSVVYGTFLDKDHSADDNVEQKEFGVRQVLVLIDLLVMIIVLIWGVKTKGWYFAEISTLFLIMGIIAAIIMGYGPQKIGKIIAEGFASAAVPALMVGLARGILMVMQSGTIIDTVVYGLSIPMAHFPAWLTGVAMLIMQTILNFFIPSGSGQAATSMPIMAPLADLLGVSRDTACLAFQFGDGLSNIIWPTAYAAVMSGLAGVKLDRWWKFAFPVFGVLVLTQAALLIFSVMTGFGG